MDKSRKIAVIGRVILICLIGPVVAGVGSIPLLIIDNRWNAGFYMGFHFVCALFFGAIFGLIGGLIAYKGRFVGAAVGGIVALLPAAFMVILLRLG